MSDNGSLQALLPEEHRGVLAVVPRRSLKYGVLAVAMLFFGLGLGIGSNGTVAPYALWVGLAAVGGALVLGWLVNRREHALLESMRRTD